MNDHGNEAPSGLQSIGRRVCQLQQVDIMTAPDWAIFYQVLRGWLHCGRSNSIEDQRASAFGLRRPRFHLVARTLAVCLYVLAVSPLIWTASSAAAEYHGAGYVDYRVFSRDPKQRGSVIAKEHLNFVFAVSNDLWRICMYPPSPGVKIEHSYDRTNTYIITSLGTNMVANIYPTQYPPPNGDGAIAVWLAYCSGAYMSSATNNMLCSLSAEPYPWVTAYGHPRRSEFEFLDTALHIPRKCVQFSDGAFYDFDITKRPPFTVGYRFTGVFSKGFPEVAYSVGETTNVDGLTLPKTFQFQQFMPKEGSSSSNDVFAIGEFVGCLQSIEVGASNIGNDVHLHRNVIVDDYRGLKLDPPIKLVQYFSPSSSWLPFSPGSMPYTLYENRKRIQSASVAQSHSKRALVIAVLVVLTAIPLVGAWAPRFFRRTSANNQ